MADIEQKALALVNEIELERGSAPYSKLDRHSHGGAEAIYRAIEQHEAFRQRVSDMGEVYIKHAFTVQEKHLTGYKVTVAFENHDDAIAWFDQLLFLPEFIIPKPKPDPLHECLEDALARNGEDLSEHTERFRAALEARGLEIREKNDE